LAGRQCDVLCLMDTETSTADGRSSIKYLNKCKKLVSALRKVLDFTMLAFVIDYDKTEKAV